MRRHYSIPLGYLLVDKNEVEETGVKIYRRRIGKKVLD